MKSILTAILFIGSLNLAYAQCMIEPWSLQKRVDKSSDIIEARVVNQEGRWDAQRNNIYTINTLEVFKVFKGTISTQTIKLVTEGGIVGNEMLKVSPSLELNRGESGIFLLEENKVNLNLAGKMYKPSSSVQSFVLYDLIAVKAYDIQKTYTSISYDVYQDIVSAVGTSYIELKAFDAEKNNKKIKALAQPVISSFSDTIVTAGTSTEITINGSNFGFGRGSGKVGFKDANFGDGRYYYVPTDWGYTSWSNSQIKVRVPARAGTGDVQVINNLGESGVSTSDLTVDWAHLNIVTFSPSNISDTPFFEIQHIDDNSLGGYTWRMTSSFASGADASASFLRSLNEWKCETEMNWEIGTNTTNHGLGDDGTNTVRWTSYTDSRLGVCYSRFSGCQVNGQTDANWFVNEFDIEFDSTRNWYFGTLAPAANQFDFESVATHELGHGHQLGHVRASEKVMHFSIGNGQRKPDLSTTDIAAGNYVQAKSVTNAICSKGKMIAGACVTSPPVANIGTDETNVCKGISITFSDLSTGDNITSVAWDFGEDASLDSALTSGPHAVSYSSDGTKTIRLITANANGIDTAIQTVTIRPVVDSFPLFKNVDDTACKISTVYEVEFLAASSDYDWTISGGGDVRAQNGNKYTIEWTEEGVHSISVNGKNNCGTGPVLTKEIVVLADPVAVFTQIETGVNVAFTNASTSAESYLWTFGDGATSTEENPNHRFADKGEFTTTLTAENRCGNNSSDTILFLNYGAGIESIADKLTVYPNPVKVGGKVFLEEGQFKAYRLIDIRGAVVLEGTLENNAVSIGVTAVGMYTLEIISTEGSASYRLHIIE
jgi:PKD repeat protein